MPETVSPNPIPRRNLLAPLNIDPLAVQMQLNRLEAEYKARRKKALDTLRIPYQADRLRLTRVLDALGDTVPKPPAAEPDPAQGEEI